MTTFIQRLCGCNEARASYLQRVIKIWAAYLGLVCLGGILFGVAVFLWSDRHYVEMRGHYQVENQRMQDINRDLLLIIQDRLPAIAKTANDAASTAKSAADSVQGAATTAQGAARAAKSASSEASRAASSAQSAATDIDRALNLPPAAPKAAPEWLGGR